jgi:MSHA biogenesis protein MshN
MSLINKMLQDLDARRGSGMAPHQALPLLRAKQRRGPQMVVGGLAVLAGAAVIGAAGYAGWRYLKTGAPGKFGTQQAQAPTAAPPAPPLAAAVATAAVPIAAPAPARKTPAAAPEQRPAEVVQAAAPLAAQPEPNAEVAERAPPPQPAVAVQPARVVKGGRGVPAAALPAVRESTPQQKAEGEYKRATSVLAEGRIGEAIAALMQALDHDPRHEPARQTLVGLLLEARRSEEAMRVLQAGLALDARQPNVAMLLARLQLERGGPAIETLQRTLPYAAGNPDYHAFLAGALQREQRHREAIEQYQLAVRGAPQNGVWWMGLGISMHAEKRNPEALDAFQRARSGGGMSPELLSFVERRLQQLSR